MTLNLNSLIKQSKDPVCADIDGELVMMSIERGSYFGLDSIGNRIWQLIESPIRISEICNQLQQEFEVKTQICEIDTLNFLNDLAEQGLIEVD